MVSRWLWLAGVTLVPWIELRGSIPLALAWEMPWGWVLAAAVAVNALIFFPTYFGLKLFYERWLSRTILRRWVEGVRRKGEPLIRKYGVVGLALFVAVPLPGTGAYSGSALAFLFGYPPRRAFLSVVLGVLIAGVVVTLLSTGVLAGLRWF